MQELIKTKQLHGKRCHRYVVSRQRFEVCVGVNFSSKQLNADRSSEHIIGSSMCAQGDAYVDWADKDDHVMV